jgi:dienelactone hydrolase
MRIRLWHPILLGALSMLAFACGAAPAVPGPGPGTSGLIPLKSFARHAALGDPALSTDGKYLAVRMDQPDGKHHAVVVYRISDMKVTSILKMPIFQLPADITWVSPTRLVIAKAKVTGSIEKPQLTGEIIASDYNGKNQQYLYGYHAKGRRTTTRARDEGNATIEGTPQTPNGHFYMDVQPWGLANVSMVYDVDSVHNTRHLVADIQQGGMNFLVNRAGKATYAYGINGKNQFLAFRRDDNRWIPLPKSIVGSYFRPFAYSADGKKLYAFASKGSGPYRLIEANADASNPKTLISDNFSSIGHLQWAPKPIHPFAAANELGIPKPRFINANLPVAKLYRALAKAFPGQFVNFIDFSQDGMQLLFSTSSDHNPGTYYLINRHGNKVTKLFDAAPWIKPAQMSARTPFRFKASDGTELEAILTFPKGRRQTNLPMILLPHGGPYRIQDDWQMEDGAWDAQLLASRGYLVLQVNYRGSGGRGESFIQAGYRKWGTRIQQDLIDGVKWAIAQKYANPKKICVYGASFGGYSALMQVIRAPNLYQCAIGYAGVYDLDMLFHKGDVYQDTSGRNYLHMVLGDNKQTLAANSPVDLVNKIHVPVFLVHGKDDTRAPYAGAKEMRSALEDAGKPVQWMAKSGEGHGFYDEQNNIELFTKMFAFLKQNIGPGAPVLNAAQPSR